MYLLESLFSSQIKAESFLSVRIVEDQVSGCVQIKVVQGPITTAMMLFVCRLENFKRDASYLTSAMMSWKIVSSNQTRAALTQYKYSTDRS